MACVRLTTRNEILGTADISKLLKESRFANYDEQDQRVICENLDRIMDEIDRASRQLAALDSLVKSVCRDVRGSMSLTANPSSLGMLFKKNWRQNAVHERPHYTADIQGSKVRRHRKKQDSV